MTIGFNMSTFENTGFMFWLCSHLQSVFQKIPIHNEKEMIEHPGHVHWVSDLWPLCPFSTIFVCSDNIKLYHFTMQLLT